jgi:hypothetical protein
MSNISLRLLALGAVVGSSAFLFGTLAEAAMPVAPLATGADIVHVAQGCGPGRWRTPGGWCRGPAPVVVAPVVGVGPVVVGVGPVYAWGVGRPGWRWDGHCWRGPAGGLHCN